MIGAEVSGAAQAGGYFGVGERRPATHPDGPVFGSGTVGRWMLGEWIASAVWLLIVWRVVDGY